MAELDESGLNEIHDGDVLLDVRQSIEELRGAALAAEPKRKDHLLRRVKIYERIYEIVQVHVNDKEADDLREAAFALYEEVEMAESVGICLPDRVPSLRLGQLLMKGVEINAEEGVQ